MGDFRVPLIIRGEVIDNCEVEVADRSGGFSFFCPDAAKYVRRIVAPSTDVLADLYTIDFEEIIAFLDRLAERLDLDTNRYWREAFEVGCRTSNLSRPVLEAMYRDSPSALRARAVREVAETRIGIRFLEGWAPSALSGGRTIKVRAVGARSVHLIAGNVPLPAITTLLRSAITRNDAIVKAPRNDPL